MKINKDKAERIAKRDAKLCKSDLYSSITDTGKYIEAMHKSLKGVRWKHSVQDFEESPLCNIYGIIEGFKNGGTTTKINLSRATVVERGKTREITPIRIEQRIIEHVLCDNIIMPIFQPRLIYANGASLPGKGTDFERRLMDRYMADAVKNGYEYAVQFDFKKYFDSIPHKLIKRCIYDGIDDEQIRAIIMNIVTQHKRGYYMIQNGKGNKNHRPETIITNDEYKAKIKRLEAMEDSGICLGSQVSQALALLIPNELDHYIKDTLRIKYYARYMDDGIILCKDKDEANLIYNLVKRKVDKLGLILNDKKTRIVKLSRGFTFLKVRYYVKSGKIYKRLHKQGIVRMRRKLKRMFGLRGAGKVTDEDIFSSLQSWWTHSFVAGAYNARVRMLDLYKQHSTYKTMWFELRLKELPQKVK